MKQKMNKPKVFDVVRLYDYSEKHINAFAKIIKVYQDESVWISNLNMPFLGTISKVLSKEEFEKITTKNIKNGI